MYRTKSLLLTLTTTIILASDPTIYDALPYLPKNAVIVEAGAHNGDDSIKMASCFPEGHVYAFEPVPNIYETLKQNSSNYKNISCYNYALSNREGTAKMFMSYEAGDASSSLYEPDKHTEIWPSVLFNECAAIPITTLDIWAKNHSVDHVDFLWLDMQGGEYEALKSSPTILKTVKALITEVSCVQLYKNTPLYPEYKNWLQKEGFTPIKECLYSHNGKLITGNVLFIRK